MSNGRTDRGAGGGFEWVLARYWGLLLLVLVWVAGVSWLFVAGNHAMEDAEKLASTRSPARTIAEEDRCEPPASTEPVEPAAGEAVTEDPARATLTLRENATTTVAFGRGTGEQVREFDYDIVDPEGLLADADCIVVELGRFTRDTGDAQLEPTRISATATLTGTRALVAVSFDRTQAALGEPGTYEGMVRIVDPRVERTDVTLQVTMAYPFWQIPLAFFVLTLFPAISYLWLLKGSFGKGDRLKPAQFQKYVFSRNGILAIGAGAVAATGIFSASYLSGATWGSDLAVQGLVLVGSSFAAFAAAATAVAAAGADRPTEEPPPPPVT